MSIVKGIGLGWSTIINNRQRVLDGIQMAMTILQVWSSHAAESKHGKQGHAEQQARGEQQPSKN